MKLRFSITKDGKEIASQISDVVKPGDIAKAVESVFNQARSVHRELLWDCEVKMSPVDKSI
jgi:hypothetical protein